MAYWVKKAFAKNKGALHRSLGVPQGKKIPRSRLQAASKKPGRLGARARLALTARSFQH
jgi:hypothetical protein